MNINGVWEIIPLLTQGYIRCLNNLKHKIKGQDLEASEEFILTIRRALIILYKNFEFIKNNLTNPKFDIIDFLKLEDNKSGNSLIYKVFEYSQEIKNEATSNTFFKYEIKIGPIGPVVMYSGSLQMANFHQVCSYLLLFKHHLPRIKNWKYFLFFLQYIRILCCQFHIQLI